MNRPERDEAREARIRDEAIVDAYGPEEQAMGWYCYLDEHLRNTFKAKCIKERSISPLEVGEVVEIDGMAPESECEHEMFVKIKWNKRALAVPLAQLECLDDDEATKQAVSDWHYWVNRGYIF